MKRKRPNLRRGMTSRQVLFYLEHIGDVHFAANKDQAEIVAELSALRAPLAKAMSYLTQRFAAQAIIDGLLPDVERLVQLTNTPQPARLNTWHGDVRWLVSSMARRLDLDGPDDVSET